MKKSSWISGGILILSFFSGVFIFKKNQQSSVTYETIKKSSIVESVYGIGTLTAEKSLSIKSGVTSTILKLYVQEGKVVKKGAPLTNLEGIGTFTAPFAGTIVSSPFKEGETVFPQTSIMTLIDLTKTYLLVSIEQQGALRIKPGLPVRVSFDGLRDKVFNGRVESIYSNTSDFLARISVQSLPQIILPGMTADVSIVLQEKKDILLVPVAALELKNAVIKRNGKILRIPIELGLTDGAYAEVKSGDIKVGDEAVMRKRVAP